MNQSKSRFSVELRHVIRPSEKYCDYFDYLCVPSFRKGNSGLFGTGAKGGWLQPTVVGDRLYRSKAGLAKVEYDPMDLIRFIQRSFALLNTMMERAGMSEWAIYQRTKEVFEHFHLPFEAKPPEG
jgi:hypothetical protein